MLIHPLLRRNCQSFRWQRRPVLMLHRFLLAYCASGLLGASIDGSARRLLLTWYILLRTFSLSLCLGQHNNLRT